MDAEYEAARARLRALVYDRENDEAADSRFPWRQRTPAEWVERHGHTVCFPLHRFRSKNAKLGRRIGRVFELLPLESRGRGALDVYRKQYLSSAEYDRVQREIADPRREAEMMLGKAEAEHRV